MRSSWMASIWLVGLLVASGAWAQGTDPAADPNAAALSEADPAAPQDDPWSSPEIAAPVMGGEVVKRPHSSNVLTGGEPMSRSRAWLRTSASLAGVVALIILLAWGYRLVTGASGRLSLAGRARHPELIEKIGRVSLSPRQSLHLVRVGPQLVLIGATHDSLRALSIIEDPDLAARLAGRQAQGKADSHLAEFHRCLETETEEYDDRDRQPRDVVAFGGGGVNALKQRLAQAVQRLQVAAKRA